MASILTIQAHSESKVSLRIEKIDDYRLKLLLLELSKYPIQKLPTGSASERPRLHIDLYNQFISIAVAEVILLTLDKLPIKLILTLSMKGYE